MVKKLRKINPSKETDAPLTGSVKDSAQQIWQAGLGAFNKAQAEGSKAFEALVKEGVSLQRKTQSAAEEKISQATSKMSSMANDITSKASGQWDKLENIFEDRVAKVLNKMGVPSAMDVSTLIARIDELDRSVKKLSDKEQTPKTTAKVVSKATVKKTAKTAVKPALKAAFKTAAAPAKKPAVKRASARKSATVAQEATPH